MLDIVLKVLPFAKTVVLEFYSNLTKGMGDPTSPDFHIVYVRVHKFAFSLGVINSYLRCPDPIEPIPQPSIQEIVTTITGGSLPSFPQKDNVRSSVLFTRYVGLHKIGIYN